MLRRDGQPARIGWCGESERRSVLSPREPGAWKGCLQAGTGRSQDVPRVVLDPVKFSVPLFLDAFGALLFLQQKGAFLWVAFALPLRPIRSDPIRSDPASAGRCIDSFLRFPMMGHGLCQPAEGANFSAQSMSARLFTNGVPPGRPARHAARRGFGEGFLVRHAPVREAT